MKASPSACKFIRVGTQHLAALCHVDAVGSQVPWSERMLADELRHPHSYIFGAFEADRLCGFLIGRLMVDEVHVLNLVVDPECRRRGIGVGLLDYALSEFASLDLKWATLEVRVSNYQARGLYSQFGFIEIGKRQRYYSDNGEDALILSSDLRAFSAYASQAGLRVGNF